MPVDVVLRDFDGSKTIFPTELPLKNIIHTVDTDLETVVEKLYVKLKRRTSMAGSCTPNTDEWRI